MLKICQMQLFSKIPQSNIKDVPCFPTKLPKASASWQWGKRKTKKAIAFLFKDENEFFLNESVSDEFFLNESEPLGESGTDVSDGTDKSSLN